MDVSVLSTVYHGTHLPEMKKICQKPKTAVFKGNMKQWRIMRPAGRYTERFCTYVSETKLNPKPKPLKSDIPFGPFLWFGTEENETDAYGPCQFQFEFKSTLEAYQRSRGNSRKICYRAGGTLLYQKEVSHVVIVCCEDDYQCQHYPLIIGTNTKYFKPPMKIAAKSGTGNSYTFEDGLLVYRDMPPRELSYPAIISNNFHNEDSRRHEHVVLAFYLPDGKTIELTNEMGEACDVARKHYEYCMRLKKSEECKTDESELHDVLKKFNGFERIDGYVVY